ncbi:MAG: class I SAM-dependent methyltransferase [Methanoregula sp.]
MRSEYWEKNWDKLVEEKEDIQLVSGWGNRKFQEMLFAINDTSKKLDLKCQDTLLDIGCGAGIFEIAFTHWVKEIDAVDFSSEMVKLAKKQTISYSNVNIQRANIKALPYKNEYFDKLLVNGVIQYLDSMDEVKKAIQELNRVLKNDGILCLSLIPDAEKRDDFLNGFYSLGLRENQIRDRIEKNSNIIWFSKETILDLLDTSGFISYTIEKPCIEFLNKYFFDVVVTK